VLISLLQFLVFRRVVDGLLFAGAAALCLLQ
jgi:hypothetical protein